MTTPLGAERQQLIAEGPIDDRTLNTLRIMSYAVMCHIHEAWPCMHCVKRLLDLGAHALPLLDRIAELEQAARETGKPLSGQGNSADHHTEPRYDLIGEAGFWLAPEVCT